MKRVVDVLYGLQGYPNAARFTEFKTDLFANGSTPPITVDTASTTGITVSAACTTGLLISGACSSDGISITGICADAIHISGANTVSGLHISGDQAIAILYDVTAAATDGLRIAVPTGITLTDGIDMTCTGTGTITNAISITYTNSATEVIAVTVATGKTVTTGMSFSGAGTYTTGILLDATAIGTGISITGTCATAGIDFGAASVTTGTLIDYIGITGKVSGYLFNGSMTTSTLTGSTLIDDFACSCAHDGLTADTLRMIRRQWTGTMANGAAAAAFKLAEFVWNGTYGDGGALGGDPTILTLSSTTTFNDSGADFRALDIDISGVTLTSVANVYGIDITGKTGVDAGIHITTCTAGISLAGTITNGIDVLAAATMTNFVKFNTFAGCLSYADVDPKDIPSAGGLGADGCIQIDVGGSDYFIPIFMTTLS